MKDYLLYGLEECLFLTIVIKCLPNYQKTFVNYLHFQNVKQKDIVT